MTAVCLAGMDARGASTTGAGIATAGLALALQAVAPRTDPSRATAALVNADISLLLQNNQSCNIGVAKHKKVSARKDAQACRAFLHVLRARCAEVPAFLLLFRFIFANNGDMAITRRQHEVYDFISRFVTEHGYSPSFEVIVLEVRGDSMQDEAILDGDYVLVEKARTAHNGDIVVALVDSADATLKRFYREGDKIRLQPSNAAMKPIIVPAGSVDVQGRV